MPIQTYSSFLRVTKLCGTCVPPSIQADLDPIKVFTILFSPALALIISFAQHDDQKVKDYGVSLAVKMIQRLVDEDGILGFQISTLNLEKSVQRILEVLQWAPGHLQVQNKLIAVGGKT